MHHFARNGSARNKLSHMKRINKNRILDSFTRFWSGAAFFSFFFLSIALSRPYNLVITFDHFHLKCHCIHSIYIFFSPPNWRGWICVHFHNTVQHTECVISLSLVRSVSLALDATPRRPRASPWSAILPDALAFARECTLIDIKWPIISIFTSITIRLNTLLTPIRRRAEFIISAVFWVFNLFSPCIGGGPPAKRRYVGVILGECEMRSRYKSFSQPHSLEPPTSK